MKKNLFFRLSAKMGQTRSHKGSNFRKVSKGSERIGARNPKVRGMIAYEDSEFSLFSTLVKRRKTSISINILVPK